MFPPQFDCLGPALKGFRPAIPLHIDPGDENQARTEQPDVPYPSELVPG